MEMLKGLFEKALSEGLVPFMMLHTNGTRPKKNAIRLIEIALVVIPIMFSIAYYGGQFVNTLENINNTQIAIQKEMKEMRTESINTRIDLNTITTRFESFLDFQKLGDNIGEETN